MKYYVNVYITSTGRQFFGPHYFMHKDAVDSAQDARFSAHTPAVYRLHVTYKDAVSPWLGRERLRSKS